MNRTATARSSSPDLPELLTAKELELLLKIDVKTIYSYVARGLMPYVKIQSNVRFRKREILEWIEAQSYRPRATSHLDSEDTLAVTLSAKASRF